MITQGSTHLFAGAYFLRLDVVNDEVAEGYDPLRDEQGVIVDWKKNIYSYPPIGSPDSGAYVTASELNQFLRKLQAGASLSNMSYCLKRMRS